MKKKNRSRLDRRLKNTNSNKPDDRLSSLPDDVICRILYFLPTTKSYVQTSVLAKGWRRLWTRVTSLEFGSKDEPLADSKTINEVMSRHKGQTIHTFHLHFPENYDHNSCTDSELESWIVTAVEGGVRYLLIHFHHQLIKLPTCLFTTKTLVDLTLRDCGNIPAGPTACNFPALKKLVLDNVWYESDESLPRLLSGCPVLDELAVKFEYSQINIEVRSSTLTRLTVDSGLGYESVHKLSLDTPALRCLHLRSRRFEILSAGTLTCLTEADVYSNVHRYYYDSDWEGDDDDEIERKVSYSRSVTEFVGELYNVECLKLVTFGIVPYPTFPDLSHKFRNLTELNLRDGFCFLTSFLENADSLRLLTMVGCYDWKEPKQVPACLISSLEAVTLDEYQFCEECEFEMVRYILRNGKVLKRMSITIRDYGYNYPSYKKEKFEALKRLALFERGSDSCRLAFEIISS